jgi:hypothetical protein
MTIPFTREKTSYIPSHCPAPNHAWSHEHLSQIKWPIYYKRYHSRESYLSSSLCLLLQIFEYSKILYGINNQRLLSYAITQLMAVDPDIRIVTNAKCPRLLHTQWLTFQIDFWFILGTPEKNGWLCSDALGIFPVAQSYPSANARVAANSQLHHWNCYKSLVCVDLMNCSTGVGAKKIRQKWIAGSVDDARMLQLWRRKYCW